MPDYSRTRSEFMRIMSGGGETTGFSPDAINDVNDASFDAAALTQIMADNALRKPETQSAFDGSRPIGEASATEEQEQAGFGEFIGNVNHSVIEGFMNSVDALWDFGMDIVGGLFGGGWFGAENELTDWTQSAIENDEWVDQSVRAMSAMGYVLTDDFWTNDNGFWTDWSHENTLALNEQHYNGQEWVRKVGNFAGEMIPQIALAAATMGQSLTVQLATQTAMGFSRQFGRSVEQAFNEGASYQQASAYGAASGAVEAAFSAASVGIGGFLASKGSQGIITRASQEVGKVFGKAFNSATLQTVAGKATEIILNAAEEGGEEVVAGLLDPVFRQIYDDQAIYNAYGTPENTKSYIASLGQAFLTAAAGAALMGVGREIGSFAGQGGWQGYSKNYLSEVQTSDNFRYLREYDREHGTSYSSDYVQSTYANQRIVQANEDLKADLERLKNEGASEAYIKEYGEYWQGQIKKMTSKYNETYSKVFEDASRILEQRNEAQSQKRGTGLGFSRPTDTEGEVTTHRAPSPEATAETVGEPETVAKPKVIRAIDDAGNSVSYVNADTAKQLAEALADNNADTPDTMRLPVKTDYSEDPIFVSRSSLSDAEKTRLSSLTSDDIKTEGITQYADLSPDKILVFNEGKGGVYTASFVDEETGSRHFNIDGLEIELPPVYAGLAVTYDETTSLADFDANGHLPEGQTRNARDILTMTSPEFHSFKAKLSDAVDDSHALKLLNLSKRKHYEGLANAKMAKQLTNSDIDALPTMAERNLTSDEIEATDIYKYAKRYVEEHPTLKVSEHPDLVQKTKAEFKDLLLKQATERNGGQEPPKNHKAVFVAGLPGAGKSSGAAKQFLDAGAIEFDNDIAKTVPSLSEYYAGGLGAGTVQNIVSQAQLELWDDFLKEGYDIVYPAIGKKLSKVQEELQRFADYGYDVDYVFVHVSNETSQNRAFKRYIETGRFVDPVGYIKELGDAPDNVYNSLRNGNQEAQQGRASQNDAAADNRQGQGVRQGDGLRVQSGPNAGDTPQGSGSGGPDGLSDGSPIIYRYQASDGSSHRIALNSLQRIDNEPSSSDRAGSVDVPRAPSQEVQGKYGKNVSKNAPSLILEAANAKEGNTYALSRSKAMMDDIDDYVSDMLSSEGELSGRFKVKATDKAEITREVFADLNLSKDPDLTAKVRDYLNGRVFEQEVAYVDENGKVTERFKLGDLLDSKARSQVEGKLNEAFDELLSHGRTSRYQQMEERLQSQIDRLIGEVTETKERARLVASAHKKVNSLRNKLGTNAQPGKVARVLRNGSDADIDAVNLFRSLVGDVRISSKTGLTVSPKGANDLIDFANQFTFEKFGESAFWSDELKSELDHLSSLAGNGKFSEDQALPVEAMRTINNVLDAINHKLKDNQIAYYERSRAAASDAARGLNFTSASSVTRLGNLVSSAENIPTYFKMYLGEENPAYDVIIRDQVKADGNMLSYQQKYDGELNAIVEGEGMKLKEWDRAMKKKAEFKGAKYTQGELISTYFSAKTKKGIADGTNALTFYDRKGKNYSRRLRLNGEADVKALREAIDPTLLRIAERQQSEVLGGTMTKDFVKQFRLKNGFDPEVSKDYFMLTGDGAAVDISNARNALGSGYTMSNTWRRERSRNSSYKGDYRIVDYRTQLANYANELARYIGYGDYNENIRVLFNTKIDVDGDGHKRSFNDLLREKAPNWAPSSGNKGRSWFNYFQERVTGGSSRNDEGFLGIFTRAGQASVLGLNPRSMAKQFLSDFTVMGDVGFETWLSSKKRVAYNLANYSKVKKFMMGMDEAYSPTDPDYAEYEPYFALIRERFLNKGAVKGELSSDAMKTVSGRIADFTMKGMSFFDEANNVINVWSVAETMAKQYNGLAYGTKANKLQAMKYFVDLVLNTQSNNNAFYVSRLRSGYEGSIMRLAFGLFGSDNQNRLQQIDLLIRGKRQANKRRAAYESIIKNESSSKADKELASKMIKSLDANWSGPNYAKRFRGVAVALAANAIGIAVIDQLFDRILAKDDKTFRDGYDEEDALQLLQDVGMNMVNWLPYAGELIDLAVNDYELSVFPLERINTISQTGSEFVRALQSGDRQRISKAIVDVVKVAGELGGLPLDNVYKYAKGITRNASESAYIYGFRWMEGLTNGQLNAYYNEAIKDKRLTDAKTALSTNYAFYKTGNVDERTIKEIARLSSSGYNAVAKNVPDYLTDEEGNQTELSGNQRSAFRSAYSKANGEVRNLVTGYQYQRLSDASKAKAIKRVYDAYYEYARFVITGEAPTSRLGQLLSASRGSFDRIDELATLMGEVGELEADGGESKKDKAMRTVNGYRGLSNAQKLIALALLGYAIPEGSEQSALSYLKSLGLNNAEAKAFLRIE